MHAILARLRLGHALQAERREVVAVTDEHEPAVVHRLAGGPLQQRRPERRNAIDVDAIQREEREPQLRHHQPPISSSTACPNTSVCRSTSSAVVAGDISAMLWNGVISTPRFSRYRWISGSSSSSWPAAASHPLPARSGPNTSTARRTSPNPHHRPPPGS